jgi:hypothetical protein
MTFPTTTLPTKYCHSCGAIIDGRAPVCPSCSAKQPVPYAPAGGLAYVESEKRILPALVLAFILGPFGAHRFYTGKIGTGILQLCTLGGLGVWLTIDIVMLAIGKFRDKEGNLITEWT